MECVASFSLPGIELTEIVLAMPLCSCMGQAQAPVGTQSIASFLQAAPTKQGTQSSQARAEFYASRNMHHVTDF